MGVAVLATAFAYVAMVGFATDVLEISPVSAYVFAGVYELSLITVALLAREAAQQDRPARTQLLMTWVFSAASGILAGYHELDAGHGAVAAGFRFTIPVVAALMWHFALVGDRHLASMRSWTDLRQAVQIHSVITASSRWFEAQGRAAGKGGRRAQRAVERRNQARLRAMTRAMRSVPAGELRGRLVDWDDGVLAMSELTATVGRAVVMDAETGVRVVEQLTQVMTQAAAPRPGAAAQLEFAASRSVAQEQVPLAIAAASTGAAVPQRHAGAAAPAPAAPAPAAPAPAAPAPAAPAPAAPAPAAPAPAAPAPAAGAPAAQDAPLSEDVAHQAAPSSKGGAAAARSAADAASRTMRQAPSSQPAASSDSGAAPSAPESAASTQLRDAGVAQSPVVAADTALQRRASRATARGQVDLMEVHRMRSAGESWRKIGPALSPPVSPDTARRAYEDAQKAPETPARGLLLKELQSS